MSCCAFVDCFTSKRVYPNLHLFRFPVKDEKRCKKWMESTGCPERFAHLTPKQLSSRGIVCALHFERSSFMNSLCHRLTLSAVPIAGFINQDLLPMLDKHKTQEEINSIILQRDPKIREQLSITSNEKFVSCEPEPVVTESVDVSTLPVNDECDPLDIVYDVPTDGNQEEVGADWKEVKYDINTEPAIQQQPATRTELVDAASKYLSGSALTLFRMQILRSESNDAKVEWTVEEKELSLTMYYKSASLYNYLRDRQGFVLPSDTDIQRWIECTKRDSF